MPGSSALTMTSPPLTPVSERLMNGSAATLRPTCFMVTMARQPASEAPTAVSSATFSLTHHCGVDALEAGDRLEDLGGRRARVAAREAGRRRARRRGRWLRSQRRRECVPRGTDYSRRHPPRQRRPRSPTLKSTLKDSPQMGENTSRHAARTSSASHDPDGATVSRPPRRRRNPALLRGRFRTLFFALLAIAALALGYWEAAVPALWAWCSVAYSVQVARARDEDLAHTFAVLDWLLLGCTLVFSGGAESWLLAAVPVLAMGQLAGAPRKEWPYLLAPTLLLLIVLAIADPSLGGSRAGGVAKVVVLVAGGWVAATRLKRPPARQPATGASRRDHRLLHWRAPRGTARRGDGRRARRASATERRMSAPRALPGLPRLPRAGAQRAARARRRTAHRAPPDGRRPGLSRARRLVRAAPGRPFSGRGSQLAAEVAHDVSSDLIAGRRQTLAAGASSFPTVRRLPDLLAAARDEVACRPARAGTPPRWRSRWRPRSDAAAPARAASCYPPPASLVFACGDRHRQRAGPRRGRRARAGAAVGARDQPALPQRRHADPAPARRCAHRPREFADPTHEHLPQRARRLGRRPLARVRRRAPQPTPSRVSSAANSTQPWRHCERPVRLPCLPDWLPTARRRASSPPCSSRTTASWWPPTPSPASPPTPSPPRWPAPSTWARASPASSASPRRSTSPSSSTRSTWCWRPSGTSSCSLSWAQPGALICEYRLNTAGA